MPYSHVEKKQLLERYRIFMSEAATELTSGRQDSQILIAHSIVRAQAIAVNYFRRTGEMIAPNAYPGEARNQDGLMIVAKPSNSPAHTVSDPADVLFDFLVDRFPQYRSEWAEFLREGIIASAVE